MPVLDSAQALETLKELEAILISIQTEAPIMLTECIGYVRSRVTLKDGRNAQAAANFALDAEGKLINGERSIEDAELVAIFRALAFLGHKTPFA